MSTSIARSGSITINKEPEFYAVADWGDGEAFNPTYVKNLIRISENKELPVPSSVAGESIVGRMITFTANSTVSDVLLLTPAAGCTMTGPNGVSKYNTITAYVMSATEYVLIGGV